MLGRNVRRLGEMALFGKKDEKSLFSKKKGTESKNPQRHELVDIPLNSIIELSDMATFEETGDTSRAYTVITRKKYTAAGLLRYMYHVQDTEGDTVIGVDRIAGTEDTYEISRWIVDGEQELGDPLPDVMTLFYPDPDSEDAEFEVTYNRQEIVTAKLDITNPQGEEEFDVQLHEYISDEEELMSIECCGNWLTFYVGMLISRSDIEIYPANGN